MDAHAALAQTLAQRFRAFPMVEAITLGGSRVGQAGDAQSDIDLYVYGAEIVPLIERQAILREFNVVRADLNLQFWDVGDEWYDGATGIEVDVMYWSVAWIEEQVERLWSHHQPSMGYSTCFWHTVQRAQVLFDRNGWYTDLQARSQQPYPEPLRQAIIAKNHAVLRRVIPSYTHQIEKAYQRADWISVNHRVAAFLASYFDVLFALNRVLHPGEKRLVTFAEAHCALLPPHMADHIAVLLQSAASAGQEGIGAAHALVDGLDALLIQAGFDPATSTPQTP